MNKVNTVTKRGEERERECSSMKGGLAVVVLGGGVYLLLVKCQYCKSLRSVKETWNQLGFLSFWLLCAYAYCTPAIYSFARNYGWMQALYHALWWLGAKILGQHMSTFQTWVKSAATQKKGGEQKSKSGSKEWEQSMNPSNYHQKLKEKKYNCLISIALC